MPDEQSPKNVCLERNYLLIANVTSINVTVVLMETLCNPSLRLHLRSIQLNGFYVFCLIVTLALPEFVKSAQ